MMKMRKRRKIVQRSALIEIRIRELLDTLDALAEDAMHSETELIQMELQDDRGAGEEKPER